MFCDCAREREGEREKSRESIVQLPVRLKLIVSVLNTDGTKNNWKMRDYSSSNITVSI